MFFIIARFFFQKTKEYDFVLLEELGFINVAGDPMERSMWSLHPHDCFVMNQYPKKLQLS